MKQSLLCLLGTLLLGIFAGCASTSPFGDDGDMHCLTASQVESIPTCRATVEKVTPCSVHLRTEDGYSLRLAGPGGAEHAIIQFMGTLENGHTYIFPDVFLEFQKKQDRSNKTN